jgi:hypothetical protein
MKRFLAIATVIPALAFTASAQDESGQVKMMKVEAERMAAQAKIVGIRGAVMGKTVKDAPYSATETTESTQVLADGTRIHNESTAQVYRDSEGRTRRETPDEVTIWDPVLKVSYILNPKDQTARQLPLGGGVFYFSQDGKAGTFSVRAPLSPVSPDLAKQKVEKDMIESKVMARQVAGGIAVAGTAGVMAGPSTIVADTGGPGPMTLMTTSNGQLKEGASESLGTQNIEGVTAEGSRTTTTIQTGAIGNDRPLQIVSERWFSPDLQTLVQTRHTDPRTGEETFHLTNISRAEPAAYLFQVPAGYQVINQK